MRLSTSEIAKLAGVSLRTVRHYHDVGLLPEPERLPNGYKQYSVTDLVLLLRIRRLSRLGFSLPQIFDLLQEDDQREAELIDTLDQELESEISRLQAIREELALSLEHDTPLDVEPESFLAAAKFDTPNQLRLGVLLSMALSSVEKEILAKFIDGTPEGYATLNEEFASLSLTSSTEDIDRVSNQLLESVLELANSELYDLRRANPFKGLPSSIAVDLIVEAFLEGLNPAQRRTLLRVLA